MTDNKKSRSRRLARLFHQEREGYETYDDDAFDEEEDVPVDPGEYVLPPTNRGLTPENSARTKLLYRLHHYYDSGDPQEKAVLLALAACHHRDRGCWPSLEKLAILTGGLSTRTIQRKLKLLENRGFLKRHYRQGRSTVYALQETKLLRLMEKEKKARDAMKQGMYIMTHKGLDDEE